MVTNSSHMEKTRLSRLTLVGLIVTMGIVFGDIGTSPLYVMKAIVAVEPAYNAGFVCHMDAYFADYVEVRPACAQGRQ